VADVQDPDFVFHDRVEDQVRISPDFSGAYPRNIRLASNERQLAKQFRISSYLPLNALGAKGLFPEM
jgi:hypothetical protein